jgi:hypothetical protein
MAEPNNAPLACGRCRTTLPWQTFNTPSLTLCPSCGAGLYAAVFPAYTRGREQSAGGSRLLGEDEAGCFYHPAKRAVMACEACGRFLCSLCHFDLAGQHLCPACVEAGRKRGKLETIARQRTLYDEAALAMAVLPLLMWPATVITAPLTLFFVARFWKAPGSLLPRTKARFVAAAAFALLEIAAWVAGITLLVLK